MRPLLRVLLVLSVVSAPRLGAADAPAASAAAPSAETAAADPKVFAYDASRDLDVKETARQTRDGAVIRDISFVGAKERVTAYLITPLDPPAASGAILYVHWLGDPETTNRTQFLNEAVALAGDGIVSLLVDTMWSQPKWYPNRVPEEDYDRSVAQVIDLRRALDLLLAQPGVDAKRVAYVGHDFGAMYGAVMGAVDHRPTTYVLIAGTPQLIDWMLFARKPQDPDAYRRQLAPLDPVRFVGQLAPAPVFFQFASHDEYVPGDAADRFYSAAKPRKQTAMYEAGHDLRNADATADRVTWLIRLIGSKG